jgi:Initiator Replication protein
MTSLTHLQKTNRDGFPKAGELIEITGAHELEASDRAILNVLYQHAHDSGRLGAPGSMFAVPVGLLRFSPDHRGIGRLRDSLRRLLRIVVTVPYTEEGVERVLMTHLLDFADVEAMDGERRGATVRFGIPRMLTPVLLQSARWGRIKAEIICAMTSKYAIALYELIQLRANMDRCVETFSYGRFRELLGVAPDTYTRGSNFFQKVVAPALLEVNGLSEIGVDIALQRKSANAPIEAVTVSWWKKQGEEYRTTLRERDRSKVGRMARLRGKTETVSAD